MTATVALKPKHKAQMTPVVPQDDQLSQYVFGKLTPQAPDLEQAVLGACMVDREGFPVVYSVLSSESFYIDAHRHIFEAMLSLWMKSQPIDELTVMEKLKEMGKLDEVGGPGYLAELTTRVASAANIEFHCRIIQQKYIRRSAIGVGATLIEDGYDDTADPLEVVDSVLENIFSIMEGMQSKEVATMSKIGAKVLKDFEDRMNREDGLTGVPGGIATLDRFTGGWQKSDLIVIAARPGMGKSAFVTSMALNATLYLGKRVAIFSLEMSDVQIFHRMISMETGIPVRKLKNPKELEAHEHQAFLNAFEKISESDIYIDDTGAIGPFELRSKARKLKKMFDIDMIIVDYLQLMQIKGRKGKSIREQEVAEISRELKAIAKELDIPVLALSQLSRAVEIRGGTKRPQLSDLRESGAIEQDADQVIFIYRPEYYDILEDEEGQSLKGVAEIIFAKNRSGDLKTIMLKFIGHRTQFVDMDDHTFDALEVFEPIPGIAGPETTPATQFPIARPSDAWEDTDPMESARTDNPIF